MAAVCDICGKHPGFGMKVSFSHKRSPRRWNPNIQRIRILEGRTPRRPQRLHLLHQGQQGPPGRLARLALVGLGPFAGLGFRLAASAGSPTGSPRR
jgi:large subunit ribosomal protein L28